MTNFEKVGLFMKTFKQEVKTSASLSSSKIIDLRVILYVTYGAGHAFGLNLDACFNEVQKSNMSKLDKDGKPIFNEKGKVMKGPNYFVPNFSKLIKD